MPEARLACETKTGASEIIGRPLCITCLKLCDGTVDGWPPLD